MCEKNVRRRRLILRINLYLLLVVSYFLLLHHDKVPEATDKSHKSKVIPAPNHKYILLWTPPEVEPFNYFGVGREAFVNNECARQNCYITSDRQLFAGDVTRFHAVLFNGRFLNDLPQDSFPKSRASHQKYIYVNQESPDYHPLCRPHFDRYFNWTFTYRLDSDIPLLYVVIKTNQTIVGPRHDMLWIRNTEDFEEGLMDKLKIKSKSIAWFVSHCGTRSHREEFVKELEDALKSLNLSVDIYGKCGSMRCPPAEPRCDSKCGSMRCPPAEPRCDSKCGSMRCPPAEPRCDSKCGSMRCPPAEPRCDSKCGSMRCPPAEPRCDSKVGEYYYYLALENSFARDYVTEKVLRALKHNAVPIVLGGAEYNRFLPPGSYIDAQNQSVQQLARHIQESITSLNLTKKYFWWKMYYTFHDATRSVNVCALCAALNDVTKINTFSVYEQFRKWWNKDFEERCKQYTYNY